MATMTNAEMELWIDTNINPAFVNPATSADIANELVAGLTAGETETQLVARLAALATPPGDPAAIVTDAVVEWNAAPAAVTTTPTRRQRARAALVAPPSRWSTWLISSIGIGIGILALVLALRGPSSDDIDSAVKAEHEVTVTELAKKADDTKVAQSFQDLGNVYLTKANASSTYVIKADADGKYMTKTDGLTKADASATYLTKANASSTYVTKADADGKYMTKTDGLTKADASAKYAPLADLQAYMTKRAAYGLLSKSSAKKTYLSKIDAVATYALKANEDGDTPEATTPTPAVTPTEPTPQSDSDVSPDTKQTVKLKVVIDGDEVKTFVGGEE